MVSYQSWVHVGSGDEARWTGVAHLFEHMMFRGSKRVPGDLRDRLLRERGSRGNAYTSNDVTVYFEDTTAEHLALVIELEAERFRHLVISPSVLDTERQVVLEERRMRSDDNANGRLIESLLSLTFLAHPYRTAHDRLAERRREGGRRDLPRVLPRLLRAEQRRDLDRRRLRRRRRDRPHPAPLRPWPRGPEPPRNPTEEPEQRGERRGVVHLPVRAPLVGVAWHAPKTGHPDGPALDLLGEVLSSGRTSRLQRKLVYEEQQALSAYGGYWELEHAGLFYAGAGVRPGTSPRAWSARCLAEIEGLRRSPAERARAREGEARARGVADREPPVPPMRSRRGMPTTRSRSAASGASTSG